MKVRSGATWRRCVATNTALAYQLACGHMLPSSNMYLVQMEVALLVCTPA